MKAFDVSLDEIFELRDGELYWLPRRGIDKEAKRFNSRHAGKIAGNRKAGSAYWQVMVNKKSYCRSHIVYAMAYDEWPEWVEHINGDTLDDRPMNLRKLPRPKSAYKSPVAGVTWDSCDKVWRVYYSRKYLGRFRLHNDAVAARRDYEDRDADK